MQKVMGIDVIILVERQVVLMRSNARYEEVCKQTIFKYFTNRP